MGRVGEGTLTVRFTYRGNVIRIYGAGYWRKGNNIVEEIQCQFFQETSDDS